VSLPSPAESQRRGRRVRGLAELAITIGVAVGAAVLIQALLVKPYRIPSGSMIPTLQINQRILVDRLDTTPGLGDVVVFHPPAGALMGYLGVCKDAGQGAGHQQACDAEQGGESSQTYVKRVVGLPGDHLKIVNGKVFRNGIEERGSYVQACDTGRSNCDFPAQFTVPRGDYYMMGDNRGLSDDSRFWGPVPQGWIIGTAFFTYWPPGRIGTL